MMDADCEECGLYIMECECQMAAPKGNNFNPNGRPQKPIDWEEFEKLCALQCTQFEIASFLKINEDTLRSRVLEHYNEDYSAIYKKYSESGKCSLRRAQFKLALKNASMAIWLGKQWLGQKDISKDDMREFAGDVINAVREIEGERTRIHETSRSPLETQQSLLDKGCSRKENQISNELGSKGAF